MNKNKTINNQDRKLFRESIIGTRKIQQNTIIHKTQIKKNFLLII